MNHSSVAPRSLRGCWTCRLRRKKCDEAHPSCQTCTNLELDCSGYDSKPEWFDGGSSQALLQHDIKMQVKKTTSRKRLVRLIRGKGRTCVATAEDSSMDTGSVGSNHSSVSAEFSEEEPPRSVSCDFELQLHQDWDGTPPGLTLSKEPQSSNAAYADTLAASGGAYSEQHLFHYFWGHIFASYFVYLPPSVAYAGRKWLPSAITNFQPLSDLTLALSACHYRNRTPFPSLQEDPTWRYYYDSGLRGLRSEIRSFGDCQSLQAFRLALQLLACNLQLILLDSQRGSRTWLVHLRGMSVLVDMIIAYDLSCEVEEPGVFDRNGLEFITQMFAFFDRASALTTVGISSYDHVK